MIYVISFRFWVGWLVRQRCHVNDRASQLPNFHCKWHRGWPAPTTTVLFRASTTRDGQPQHVAWRICSGIYSPNQNTYLPSSERNWKPESTQPSMWEKPPRAPGLNNWSQGLSLGPNNIGLSFFTTLDFSHIPVMVEGKRKIEGNMYWFLMVKTWKKPQKSQKGISIQVIRH